MGKATKQRKKKPDPISVIGPTDEQMSKAEYRRANMAYKRTPIIDTLLDTGKLSFSQYAALAYYRNQAIQAEDDYARSSTLAPERVNGGGGQSQGGGLPVVFTAAIAETGRIERDLGSLVDIARAIAVDDKSLSQWCIDKFGGRERYNAKGQFVAMVPICERRHMAFALLELRTAAGRIVT